MADKLEQDATMNYATASQLIANGADEDFVQELRDRAAEWEARAAKLREPVKRRQRGTA